jgi:2-methylcitrate dehydratase PrpD
MQSSGIMEVVAGVGSDLRGMYAGFSAKGAVLAALLAEKGVGGVGALFEGPYGVFNTYFGGKYDVAKILDNLGTEYHGAATLYKPWPAVGTSHSHIHATIGIVTEHDLRADDMDRIRVHVGDYHSVMCTPIDTRRAPTTLVDARFSLPYLVAVAAVRRSMGLRDFTLAALRDADVLRVAQKVVPVTDSSLDWNLELPPGRVDILTRDGRMLTRTGTRVPGSPDAPLTWDDITRKFSQCASFAAVPVSMQQATALHEMVRDFESVRDVADLLRVIQ